MGRRSINTTKSGKYMNPTDQARKEARKQELKKNKKQRQMVRTAVLKGKDPQLILEELEKIDQMEFNVHQPSPLNEKVLREKRKKLRDTFDRVLGMYYKDDAEKWTELKRRQTDYEHKRMEMVAFFESVKSTQHVQIDDIPLPQQQEPNMPVEASPPPPQGVVAPPESKKQHPIYSIAAALKLQALGLPVREPPGCPSGPPPIITEDGLVEEFCFKQCEESDRKTTDNRSREKSPSPPIEAMKLAPPTTNVMPPPPPPLPHHFPPFRLPPGPPPGRPMMMPPPPPHRLLPHLRLPPPLPPNRLLRFPQQNTAAPTPNVVQAAPQLVAASGGATMLLPPAIKQGATITAKPQIRNLSADVTRFVPSTLRVKREDKQRQKPNIKALANELKLKELQQLQQHTFYQSVVQPQQQQRTKDDAYKQFMEEMQTLM